MKYLIILEVLLQITFNKKMFNTNYLINKKPIFFTKKPTTLIYIYIYININFFYKMLYSIHR